MKVRNLKELQDIFNIRYEKIKNKILLIEDELKQIDEFFKTEGKNIYRPDIVDFLSNNDILPNSVLNTHWIYPPTGYFSKFKFYYEGYLYEEIEYELPENKPTGNITYKEIKNYIKGMKPVRLQAFEFAKYTIWLKEIKSVPSKKEVVERIDLPLKQRILILDYLGVKHNNNSALSEVLSLAIGKSRYNTRTCLNELKHFDKEKEVRNKENLLKMLKIFEHQDFTKIRMKINEDLEKLGVDD
tara:strand:+ start:1614 stop:2339 length:726 start_codon:yes stop_codon:yes gene_type:complete